MKKYINRLKEMSWRIDECLKRAKQRPKEKSE